MLYRTDAEIESKLNSYMKQLTKYNAVKDIGQLLLAKCGEMEFKTIKEMYDEFGLDLED